MDEYGGATGGVPAVIWAGGLLRPELLLTAVQRQAVSYLGSSLEGVSLDSRMLSTPAEELVDPPSRGVVLSGLVARGCCWSSAKLDGSVHFGTIAAAGSIHSGGDGREGRADGGGGEGGDDAVSGPTNGGTALPLVHVTGVGKSESGRGSPPVSGIVAPIPMVRRDQSTGAAQVLATLFLPAVADPARLALAGAVVELM